MNNPFNPTFGDVPKIFLPGTGENQVMDILNMITKSDFARSIFITGVRGAGKTSLMMRVAEKLRQNNQFYLVDLINRPGILLSLFRLLSDQVSSSFQKTIHSISSIAVGNISVSREVEPPNTDLLLDKLMQEVKKEGKKVLITVDEVTNSQPIRELIQNFNAFKRKKYPVYLLMTGLPDLVLNLQNEERLTFLLRSDKVVVSPLQKLSIYETYQDIFKCDQGIATKLTNMTNGYSYAFQLLGYLLFNKVNGQIPVDEDVESIKMKYQAKLFNNCYQKIFMDLSPIDQQYLYAVRDNHSLAEVSQLMGKSNVFVAQYRRRAIERHLIKPAVKRGYVCFTLPYFEKYLNETENMDSIFYIGWIGSWLSKCNYDLLKH